jgi:hypothetical protein
MDFERNDYSRDSSDAVDECKKYLYYHIVITTTDGNKFDGIIEDVDKDGITMLSGEEVMEQEDTNQSNEQRQYYDHGRPRRRFRRFRRRRFPINNLAALALLPYISPPLYPYHPYYPYY